MATPSRSTCSRELIMPRLRSGKESVRTFHASQIILRSKLGEAACCDRAVFHKWSSAAPLISQEPGIGWRIRAHLPAPTTAPPAPDGARSTPTSRGVRERAGVSIAITLVPGRQLYRREPPESPLLNLAPDNVLYHAGDGRTTRGHGKNRP